MPDRRDAPHAVRLREASFDDYPQIASLQLRYFPEVETLEEWTHLWLGNPLYQELRSRWPIGWVLEAGDKRIVGSIVNIPLPYEFDGQRVIAATGRALVTDPAYRSASLLVLDRVINQPGVDLYLNNTVGGESEKLLDLFECPRVPVGRWDEAAFWVTRYRRCTEAFLRKKGIRFAKPLSYPLSSAAFLVDRLKTRRLPLRNAQVEVCSGFDERFDEFWRDYRKSNSRRLLAVRTREVLQWHFRNASRNGRLWIVAAVEGRRLAAYAIFLRRENLRFGLRRMLLVDFRSLDDRADLLSPILAQALRMCRKEGIDTLDYTGRWLDEGEFVDTFSPYRRPLGSWTYFYRAIDPALAENLRHPHAWAPSSFDGDASL